MGRLMAALAAVLVLLAAHGPAEAKRTLRLSLQLPLRSLLGQNLVTFKEEVEAATRGEIEIQIFDSAQLFNDKVVPLAVGSGQIEMGVASLARFAEAVPAVEVFSVPFLFDGMTKLKAATAPESIIRRPLDEMILSRTGCRVLWWQPYATTVLLSKGAALKGPSSLQGKRVRASGKMLSTWVSANRGIPVSVPASEQYAALKRGQIDVAMAGPEAIRSGKLQEVANSVTAVNVATAEFVVMINESVWQGLSGEERGILGQAARRAELKLQDEFAQAEGEALDALAQSDLVIYKPTAAELAEWRKSARAARDEFLRTSGDLGRQVYDAALALE
jgi:C4-dicarboxylate-binding protein DctP